MSTNVLQLCMCCDSETMTLRATRQLSTVETSGGTVGVFRWACPLRRPRRVAVQSLVIFALVVAVTVLTASHRRRSSTVLGQLSAAADTLRRFVRSVQEPAGSGSGRAIAGDDGSSGYLQAAVGNDSRMTDVEFRSYGDAVELRLIVLAYDRPESLRACLESLGAAEYGDNDLVALHVWIDGCCSAVDHGVDDAHRKTVDVARSFNFSHGVYRVHVRSQHVGVQVG